MSKATPKLKQSKRKDRGVTTVEMAIVLPVLILVMVGMIEFGIILHTNLILQNASREGARFGAIGSSKSAIEQRVRDFTVQLKKENIAITVTNAQGERGTTLVVSTSYPVPLMTRLMKSLTKGADFTLKAQAQMRLE